MARWQGTKWGLAVLTGALTVATAPAKAANDCAQVRQLTAQGVSADEIATAFNAPLSAVVACLQPVAPHRAAIAPASNGSVSAAGPAPFGAAGPAPLGAAGPAPLGAAGPAPIGAAGPAPFRAAGGTTTSSTSQQTDKR